MRTRVGRENQNYWQEKVFVKAGWHVVFQAVACYDGYVFKIPERGLDREIKVWYLY
ncbi:hypothetical protein [Caldicellulosiruptor acetigenus]|uniref:hypothetical protein n=1 Tax=Caldicellulosiruptor acetigenus TaxID=301953 RepID=UPI0001E9A285|nr:hypothetical protein [Caldicellulosiruptor acetigenus]